MTQGGVDVFIACRQPARQSGIIKRLWHDLTNLKFGAALRVGGQENLKLADTASHFEASRNYIAEPSCKLFVVFLDSSLLTVPAGAGECGLELELAAISQKMDKLSQESRSKNFGFICVLLDTGDGIAPTHTKAVKIFSDNTWAFKDIPSSLRLKTQDDEAGYANLLDDIIAEAKRLELFPKHTPWAFDYLAKSIQIWQDGYIDEAHLDSERRSLGATSDPIGDLNRFNPQIFVELNAQQVSNRLPNGVPSGLIMATDEYDATASGLLASSNNLPLSSWLFEPYGSAVDAPTAHYAVFGERDAGKSTSLLAVALAQATATFAKGDRVLGVPQTPSPAGFLPELLTRLRPGKDGRSAARFPILMTAKDFSAASLVGSGNQGGNGDDAILDCLAKHIRQRTNVQTIDSKDVKDLLESNECVLIIDSIHEVPEPRKIIDALRGVVDLARALHNSGQGKRLQIITSYRADALSGQEWLKALNEFIELRLQPPESSWSKELYKRARDWGSTTNIPLNLADRDRLEKLDIANEAFQPSSYVATLFAPALGATSDGRFDLEELSFDYRIKNAVRRVSQSKPNADNLDDVARDLKQLMQALAFTAAEKKHPQASAQLDPDTFDHVVDVWAKSVNSKVLQSLEAKQTFYRDMLPEMSVLLGTKQNGYRFTSDKVVENLCAAHLRAALDLWFADRANDPSLPDCLLQELIESNSFQPNGWRKTLEIALTRPTSPLTGAVDSVFDWLIAATSPLYKSQDGEFGRRSWRTRFDILTLALDLHKTVRQQRDDGSSKRDVALKSTVKQMLDAPTTGLKERYSLLVRMQHFAHTFGDLKSNDTSAAIAVIQKRPSPKTTWADVGLPGHGNRIETANWPKHKQLQWNPTPVTVYDYACFLSYLEQSEARAEQLRNSGLTALDRTWDEHAADKTSPLGLKKRTERDRKRQDGVVRYSAKDTAWAAFRFNPSPVDTIMDFEGSLLRILNAIVRRSDEKVSRHRVGQKITAAWVSEWLSAPVKGSLNWEKSAFSTQLHSALMCPIVAVTWFEANMYCDYLTSLRADANKGQAGGRFRLPTGAEWKALRKVVGTDAAPWGNKVPGDKASFDPEGGNSSEVDFIYAPSPVGLFPGWTNGLDRPGIGLFDFGSNVSCWLGRTSDGFSSHESVAGAHWASFDDMLVRGQAFTNYRPWYRSRTLGFRIVWEPDQPTKTDND